MSSVSDRDRLLGISVGYMASRAVYVAARLGIADHLATGPMEGGQIAAACNCHATALNHLLLALVACEVLSQDENGCFALTDVGQALRADDSRSALQLILLYGSPPVWAAWAYLQQSVETAGTAFGIAHGMGAFEYCAANPATARLFHGAMAQETSVMPGQLVACHDFAGTRSVADIGGGNGTLLTGVLRLIPGLRGILVDTGHGLAGAADVLARAGVADRCEIVEADFFAEVPPADTYLLKSVVHDWEDDDAIRLLGACRRVMGNDGRLLLIERLLPSRVQSAYDPLMVRNLLNMPTIIGGRERTRSDFARLLAGAGLELTRVARMPQSNDHFVLEAAPV